MKLHNLLLTAALFLSAGIAFAQETATPDSAPAPGRYFTINDINEREGVTDYTWTVPDKEKRNNLLATVVQYETSGFSYKVFDTSASSDGWNQTLSVSYMLDEDNSYVVDMKNSKFLLRYSDVYNYDTETGEQKDLLKRIYYFSIPYTETVMTNIGVMTADVYSIPNKKDANNFYRVSDEQYFLSFGSATTVDGKIIANKDTQIAFGQPLPAPVTTLLIALGFGAAFVMYRNRKSVKA